MKVKVEDENDNSPAFDRHIYQGRVGARAEPGATVSGALIRVSDPDLEDRVELKLLGKAAGLFAVNGTSGEVAVAPEADIASFLRIDGDSGADQHLRKKKEADKIYLRIRATDQVLTFLLLILVSQSTVQIPISFF